MLRRAAAVFILLATLVSFSACARVREYTVGEFTLSFPSDYREEEPPQNANILLTDGDISATVSRISFIDAQLQGFAPSMSDGEFARYFLDKNGRPGDVFSYDNIPYYPYYEDVGTDTLFVLLAFYRTPYAFVVVSFSSLKSYEPKAREEMFSIMKSAVYNIK